MTHWSLRLMAKAAGFAPSTIHCIWKAFNLQAYRTETFKPTDPSVRREGARYRFICRRPNTPWFFASTKEPNPGAGPLDLRRKLQESRNRDEAIATPDDPGWSPRPEPATGSRFHGGIVVVRRSILARAHVAAESSAMSLPELEVRLIMDTMLHKTPRSESRFRRATDGILTSLPRPPALGQSGRALLAAITGKSKIRCGVHCSTEELKRDLISMRLSTTIQTLLD